MNRKCLCNIWNIFLDFQRFKFAICQTNRKRTALGASHAEDANDVDDVMTAIWRCYCHIVLAEKQGKNRTAINGSVKSEPTWVHDIFQGTLTNETRCLNCETVRTFAMQFHTTRAA